MNTATEQAIADRQPTAEECMRAERYFKEATAPIMKAKIDIYNIHIPAMTIKPDGSVDYTYNFSSSIKDTLDKTDMIIEQIGAETRRKLHGGDFR